MTKQKVLDSHIHLFSKNQLDTLSWIDPQHVLYGNNRLEEYQELTNTEDFESVGIVFLETAVKSGLEEHEWELAIEEYLFVERTANNKQLSGEGSANGSLVKAIIPWAPVPLGPDGLLKYINKLKQRTDNKANWNKVRGFRYLLQDKPDGTMLKSGFINGLNWLGENNYIFDLGIDIHSRGIQQLDELVTLDTKTKGVTYIVNHLCKPDFDIGVTEAFKKQWAEIAKSTQNTYYIKLSGAFSELSSKDASDSVENIVEIVLPWVKVFVELFGQERIIFGSDWPVSTIKFQTGDKETTINSWEKWAKIVVLIVQRLGLNSDDIFVNNTIKAYGIQQ